MRLQSISGLVQKFSYSPSVVSELPKQIDGSLLRNRSFGSARLRMRLATTEIQVDLKRIPRGEVKFENMNRNRSDYGFTTS